MHQWNGTQEQLTQVVVAVVDQVHQEHMLGTGGSGIVIIRYKLKIKVNYE